MKIIIVGCGKIGEELSRVLSSEGNDVFIIDKDEVRVEELCDKYDIMGIAGNGASHVVQLEAGVDQADLLIAVTGSDELNLLCALTARMAGNVPTITRLKNPDYRSEAAFLKEELGLAMVINQEKTAAREIARVLQFPSAIQIDSFAKGRVDIFRFRIPAGSVLDGMSMIDLHVKLHLDVLVCTAERDDKVVIPYGEFVLKSGDIISIITDVQKEEAFFKKIGLPTNKVKDTMIVGGGDIAYYLAQILTDYGIRVKIIERKMERCEALAEALPKATIVHGDGADQKLLMEEGLDSVEGFVALTDLDEQNIILSLNAKQLGARKIVTKINFITFDEVVRKLELDSTVHPRNLTAEHILQYVRARKNSMGSNVEAMHWIVEDKVEALEFMIRDNFKKTGIPLYELKLKSGILVACISREGKILLPRGRDVLRAGDTVIVVTTRQGINDIGDIFEEN